MTSLLHDKLDSHRCHPLKEGSRRDTQEIHITLPLRDRDKTLISMASMFSDETTSTGEGVVSVTKSFNVSVGKIGTEDFSKKCFCFRQNLFRCRLFGYKWSDVFTWVRSERVKRSLIKGDVARKQSLFRERFVQIVCFGILRIANKTLLVA